MNDEAVSKFFAPLMDWIGNHQFVMSVAVVVVPIAIGALALWLDRRREAEQEQQDSPIR